MHRSTSLDHLAEMATSAGSASTAEWWADAVVYQLYVRSFRDGSGDGIGDLRGIEASIDHLARLGVDAIWLNPCFASPQRDHGYDISDYFTVDPAYGTVEGMADLVAEAHTHGIRVLMDMVANHCSAEHPWFKAALAATRGSRERDRFLFRDGRGPSGDLPPNNWQSVFGGPAWTRVRKADGQPGQWYFHAFDSGQPDFNWRNPEVAGHFEQVLRFWFDLGVDGFRVDVAHGNVKAPGLPDWPGAADGTGGYNAAMWDQPEVHQIYRRWRAIADEYAPTRYFVGEVWAPSDERLRAYVGDDQLHQAFNFDLLVQPWDGSRVRAAVERGLAAGNPGHPPAWLLSNHDVHRVVSRYGQEQSLEVPDTTDLIAGARRRGAVDLALGQRRARAAALLLLALPGTAFLYQGEELGLPEVFELPAEARQDPIWLRSQGVELGRDGCRVPLPWDSASPTFGFSPNGAETTWLPQPSWFGGFAVSRQLAEPHSTLHLFRQLISLRKRLFSGELRWLDGDDPHVLAFLRGDAACVVNLSDDAVKVPARWSLGAPIISSMDSPGDASVIPADAAAWFELLPDSTRDRDAISRDIPTNKSQPVASVPAFDKEQ